MANYILGIKFTGPVNSGETISWSWSGFSGPVITQTETFVPVRSAAFQTTIASPSNNIQQAINLYDAALADYTANINISRVDNIVFISSKNTSNPMSGSTTASGITFTNGIVDLVQDVVVRSPYFIYSDEDNNFDTTKFVFKAYEGNLFTGNTAPVTYEITKQKLLTSQNKIYVNTNNLVKERLEADVSTFFATGTTIAEDLPIRMSKWVEIEKTNFFNNIEVSNNTERLFVLDGYIYPTEEQGIPQVLISGSKRYINSNQVQRIYFKTNDLVTASATTFSSSGSTGVELTYSNQPEINTKYVQSVKVANEVGVDRIQYTFVYVNETVVVDFYVYNECLYDLYTIVFKNRWGVLESMPMTKKATKELTITSKELNRSIVDYNGDFNVNRHTNKQFNTNGKERFTLNTEFLPEYMNQAVEELSLSEELWLVKDDAIYPIIRVNDNINFKTKLNDKLIQYSMQVELSHNIIKNIL
jgi:hypothetical protein